MVRSCILCKHKHGTDSCKMHLFPCDQTKCRKWLRLCKIRGTPRKLPARVHPCSCHFAQKRGPTDKSPDPLPFEPPSSSSKPYKMKSIRQRTPFKNTVGPSIIPDDLALGLSPPDQDVDDVVDVATPTKTTSAKTTPAKTPTTPHVSHETDGIYDNQDMMSIRSNSLEFNRETSFGDLAQRLQSNSFNETVNEQPPEEMVYEINKPNTSRQMDNHPVLSQVPEVEVERGQSTHSETTQQPNSPLFSYTKSQSWSDGDFVYFTGISREAFSVLYDLLKDEGCDKLKYKPGQKTPLNVLYSLEETERRVKDKLFMTLVRLRRGFSVRDMEMIFGVSKYTVSSTFTTWIRLLSITFKAMEEFIFVSAAAQAKNLPDCYKPFPNLRCVVDSTDLKIQKPSNMQQQCNTFSNYKSTNVIKFLVASSLYGGLSFISEGMEGSVSDRQLFLKSGIMEHLSPGDAIMCDRGFDIEADLNEIEVDYICPPSLSGRDAFTPREILIAKSIATSRIHVESLIGRIHSLFGIHHRKRKKIHNECCLL